MQLIQETYGDDQFSDDDPDDEYIEDNLMTH
jgi:hypothetical protein